MNKFVVVSFLGVFTIAFMLVIVGFVFLNGFNAKLRLELEVIKMKSDSIVGAIEKRDRIISMRDSLLLVEIRISEGKVIKFMKLRSESWAKAKEVESEIKKMDEVRDSLIESFKKF